MKLRHGFATCFMRSNDKLLRRGVLHGSVVPDAPRGSKLRFLMSTEGRVRVPSHIILASHFLKVADILD